MDDAGATAILQRLSGGDRTAADELLPLVYHELRAIARRLVRREHHGQLVQPTSIVHEVYLRLIDERKTDWKDRAHFVAFATTLMRNILVDRARRRGAAKRGGGREHVSLDRAQVAGVARDVDILEIDALLTRLADQNERRAEIAKLRVFGGLEPRELAEVLGVSRRTIEREWRVARAWLTAELMDASIN